MSRSDDKGRTTVLFTFIVFVFYIGVSLFHILYTKGRSWFVVPYIAVFLVIALVVGALVWPRSISAQDAGFPADSGSSAQDSGDALGKQVEDTAFVPYPDESVDAGVCEVPK